MHLALIIKCKILCNTALKMCWDVVVLWEKYFD